MAESAKKIAKDIMKTEVVKVGPETPVKEVAMRRTSRVSGRRFGVWTLKG